MQRKTTNRNNPKSKIQAVRTHNANMVNLNVYLEQHLKEDIFNILDQFWLIVPRQYTMVINKGIISIGIIFRLIEIENNLPTKEDGRSLLMSIKNTLKDLRKTSQKAARTFVSEGKYGTPEFTRFCHEFFLDTTKPDDERAKSILLAAKKHIDDEIYRKTIISQIKALVVTRFIQLGFFQLEVNMYEERQDQYAHQISEIRFTHFLMKVLELKAFNSLNKEFKLMDQKTHASVSEKQKKKLEFLQNWQAVTQEMDHGSKMNSAKHEFASIAFSELEKYFKQLLNNQEIELQSQPNVDKTSYLLRFNAIQLCLNTVYDSINSLEKPLEGTNNYFIKVMSIFKEPYKESDWHLINHLIKHKYDYLTRPEQTELIKKLNKIKTNLPKICQKQETIYLQLEAILEAQLRINAMLKDISEIECKILLDTFVVQSEEIANNLKVILEQQKDALQSCRHHFHFLEKSFEIIQEKQRQQQQNNQEDLHDTPLGSDYSLSLSTTREMKELANKKLDRQKEKTEAHTNRPVGTFVDTGLDQQSSLANHGLLAKKDLQKETWLTITETKNNITNTYHVKVRIILEVKNKILIVVSDNYILNKMCVNDQTSCQHHINILKHGGFINNDSLGISGMKWASGRHGIYVKHCGNTNKHLVLYRHSIEGSNDLVFIPEEMLDHKKCDHQCYDEKIMAEKANQMGSWRTINYSAQPPQDLNLTNPSYG